MEIETEVCDKSQLNEKTNGEVSVETEVENDADRTNKITIENDNQEIVPKSKLGEINDSNVNSNESVADNKSTNNENSEVIACQKIDAIPEDKIKESDIPCDISKQTVTESILKDNVKIEAKDCQAIEDKGDALGNSIAIDKSTDFGQISKLNSNKSDELISKPAKSLVADYRSASESESEDESEPECDSVDSESDSSSSEYSESEETASDSDPELNNTKRKIKKEKIPKDLSYTDLPPIEDLKISVPEDECEEIGTITNIVDILVVVESYKGSAPLDVDSILFLDKGSRTLGKVFDVIGPVAEPVYTVRFTNKDQIKKYQIEKGMKVFCAPRTDYASYVFLPDLLKMKGSDASWKDNMEPPPECQDFSDDEEEQKYKSVLRNVRNENSRRPNPDQNPQESQKKIKTWKNRGKLRPGKFVNSSRFQCPQQFQRAVRNFQARPWSYQPQMAASQQMQSSPSFSPFPNPFARTSNQMYPNNPQFGNFRFPNVAPFPTCGNFSFTATPPPPPPPPPSSSASTSNNSYPTRMTGPPPFSSFMTAPPGNRMPAGPRFPFNQSFAQQPNFYTQHMQGNNSSVNAQSPQRLPFSAPRTFGTDIHGPPPPPPPSG